MTSPYLGEIQIFSFSFAPYQRLFANGATLPLSQYNALFSLIGTTYGGNGQSNFQIPNLTARMACGAGQGPSLSLRVLGETFGEASVTLTQNEMPQHLHTAIDWYPADPSTLVSTPTSSGAIGAASNTLIFATPGTSAPMSPSAVAMAGGNQSHENRQPALGLNYSLALFGNYPAFP